MNAQLAPELRQFSAQNIYLELIRQAAGSNFLNRYYLLFL